MHSRRPFPKHETARPRVGWWCYRERLRLAMNERLYCCVDGGASNTRVALYDDSGHRLGLTVTGPTSLTVRGTEAWGEILGALENLARAVALDDEYLSRINKFSVRELTEYGDGVWEDDLTGVFDRFYIDEDESETKYECYFDYDTSEKCMIFYTKLLKEGFPIGRSGGKFPKKTIKQIVSRKKMSIWLSQIMFPSFGTETEMKEFYQRCVFHNENNIIIWE